MSGAEETSQRMRVHSPQTAPCHGVSLLINSHGTKPGFGDKMRGRVLPNDKGDNIHEEPKLGRKLRSEVDKFPAQTCAQEFADVCRAIFVDLFYEVLGEVCIALSDVTSILVHCPRRKVVGVGAVVGRKADLQRPVFAFRACEAEEEILPNVLALAAEACACNIDAH